MAASAINVLRDEMCAVGAYCMCVCMTSLKTVMLQFRVISYFTPENLPCRYRLPHSRDRVEEQGIEKQRECFTTPNISGNKFNFASSITSCFCTGRVTSCKTLHSIKPKQDLTSDALFTPICHLLIHLKGIV